jgi:hypothetical protein
MAVATLFFAISAPGAVLIRVERSNWHRARTGCGYGTTRLACPFWKFGMGALVLALTIGGMALLFSALLYIIPSRGNRPMPNGSVAVNRGSLLWAAIEGFVFGQRLKIGRRHADQTGCKKKRSRERGKKVIGKSASHLTNASDRAAAAVAVEF